MAAAQTKSTRLNYAVHRTHVATALNVIKNHINNLQQWLYAGREREREGEGKGANGDRAVPGCCLCACNAWTTKRQHQLPAGSFPSVGALLMAGRGTAAAVAATAAIFKLTFAHVARRNEMRPNNVHTLLV